MQSGHIRSLGEAAGELTAALATMNKEDGPVCAYPPYYQLEYPDDALLADVIRKCEKEAVGHPNLQEAENLLAELRNFLPTAEAISRLPHQIIHGDINFSNAAASGHRITGILDLEFATVDVRAMELAVCLGELLADLGGNLLDDFERFVCGYGSKMMLTQAETDHLLDLVKLRRLDVFVHFLGRFSADLDPIGVLVEQMHLSTQVCRFVEDHHTELQDILDRHLLETC
ncbi:phosphotransferase [Gorillibacterium massiliense]|uniref:phosphotransferase n=1 Tax=Gorillibacterium massiliense TaxID=1280390 RepID=UPI0004BA87AF|nr:phosphotransferase [Gorillibacterium massiliense]